MRKILLASTALVALGATSAMAHLDHELSISGSTEFQYRDHAISEDPAGGIGFAANGSNGAATAMDTDIDFDFQRTTDNGLGLRLRIGLNEGGNTDDERFSISQADLGTITFHREQEGVGDSVIDAGALTNDEGISADLDALMDASTSGTRWFRKYGTSAEGTDPGVTWNSPTIQGLNVGLSYFDSGNDSNDNTVEGIVSYTHPFAQGSIALNYASTQHNSVDTNATGVIVNDNDGYDATSYGARLDYNSFSVVVDVNDRSYDNGNNDFSEISYGIQYRVAGWTLGAYNSDVDDEVHDNWEFTETAVSADYAIAPGLSAGVTLQDSKFDEGDGSNEISEDRTVFNIIASF